MVIRRDSSVSEPNSDGISLSRRTALKIVGTAATPALSGITTATTRVEQFQAIYARTPVKRTPFVLQSEEGILENGFFGCRIPQGDFVEFEVQHEGEDSRSATLFVPVETARNIDRNATYEITSVDDACGEPYRLVSSTAAENELPTAAFTVSPRHPLRGDPVTFDASESTDPDGQIEQYDWDLQTDGTVDARGERVTHTFADAGRYTATLRVTDDEGATDTAKTRFTVWMPRE